ncbi:MULTISPECIES: hypothetical protein [Streptomyces rochei group]|uniref:hypothetical protein n=1 Tax=Streptomyces rochei group TaxID=2867164 RepID=UPI0018743F5E|nr:hypothetical protein [Streptomyces vinaceusdrappus]GHC36694.1 hypothetical protein GCM10010308_63930 [Streptomyces vinaceusdrappus]
MRKRSGRPPRYAAVPNETIDDATSLDFMALALLTILLRHRDGWDITLAQIGAKYGYGRDAMANAMGLLQVARYVVKVRMMSAATNQWSTEVCVYDTPATDDEVAALLAAVSREPGVRAAQVIEPTKAALSHAAKRRSKLMPKERRERPSVAVPRVSEFPHSDTTSNDTEFPQVMPDCRVSRQSGIPAVFKKTVDQKTKEDDEPGGDGRRPSTGSRGSRAGGSAASGKTKTPFSREQRRQYDAFVAALPAPLKALVPNGLPKPLVDAVLAATDYSSAESRTVEQLIEYRLVPKWDKHYSRLDQAGPIEKPVGVLVALLRRDNECQDPRCDERTNVDTGLPCVSCEQRGIDKRAERAAAAPTPAAETAAPAPAPAVPPKRPEVPVPSPREAVITEVSEQQRSLARQALMNRPRARR